MAISSNNNNGSNNSLAAIGQAGIHDGMVIPVATPPSMQFDPQTTVSKPRQNSDAGSVAGILNAFKNEFSTSVNTVFINSLKREVPFRQISVTEQKTLSKVMIENENRRDIVYDAQCALIQDLCLDDAFDVYQITEFDRIHILIEIYQKNYLKREVTWTCKKCGAQNVYQLDFTKVSERLNNFDLSPIVYEVEDGIRRYKFTMQYPNVRRVSSFYKNYMRKYGKNLLQ